MEVISNGFELKITGKCLTNYDVIKLFNFGYSKEGIVKKIQKR